MLQAGSQSAGSRGTQVRQVLTETGGVRRLTAADAGSTMSSAAAAAKRRGDPIRPSLQPEHKHVLQSDCEARS